MTQAKCLFCIHLNGTAYNEAKRIPSHLDTRGQDFSQCTIWCPAVARVYPGLWAYTKDTRTGKRLVTGWAPNKYAIANWERQQPPTPSDDEMPTDIDLPSCPRRLVADCIA